MKNPAQSPEEIANLLLPPTQYSRPDDVNTRILLADIIRVRDNQLREAIYRIEELLGCMPYLIPEAKVDMGDLIQAAHDFLETVPNPVPCSQCEHKDNIFKNIQEMITSCANVK